MAWVLKEIQEDEEGRGRGGEGTVLEGLLEGSRIWNSRARPLFGTGCRSCNVFIHRSAWLGSAWLGWFGLLDLTWLGLLVGCDVLCMVLSRAKLCYVLWVRLYAHIPSIHSLYSSSTTPLRELQDIFI